MKKLRVCVIGVGTLDSTMLGYIACMLHDATLVGVADADLARIQALAAQYGSHAYLFASGRDDLAALDLADRATDAIGAFLR
ncbi:MAG: hypothetical protein OJF51_003770 [Nitrospira sp.]|nr:MAG: hypothetical protein OJF51_003770 [Nitrospira sp.]